ncbi:uncharacterized protein LOC118428945 isoform X2 [Branchiostoma floridae]|uniref:Uncharacterized protein LOC118428945 isoform X2 n=1 Tax=Branchiostoma floridae TaxID=7739 RepID=A0A9J7M673_BRAFL|nr:uncharacterized protein LOC118428945 isoform X2 [Branchiostoma floridae]
MCIQGHVIKYQNMAGVRISSLREVPTSLSAMPEFMDFLQSQAEALDVLTQNMETLGREEEDTGFQSCIRFNGIPILPPVMDEGRCLEMQRYRQLAAGVEHRLAVQRRDRLLNRVQTVIQKIEERRTPTPVTSPGMSGGEQSGVNTASSSHNIPSIPYNPLNYSFHDSQSDTLSSSGRDTPRDKNPDLQSNDSDTKFGHERDVSELHSGRCDEGTVDESRPRYSRESSNQSSEIGSDPNKMSYESQTVVERRKWSSEGEDSTVGQSPSSDGFECRVRSKTESTVESETKERVDSTSGDDWQGKDRSNTETTEGSLEEVDYYGMSLQNLIRKSVEEQKADKSQQNAVQTPAINPATSDSGPMIVNFSANKGDVRDDVLDNDNAEISSSCNIEGPNITRQLKTSSSFEGDSKMERSSQFTSSSSSSDSTLNRTIIAKDESLQDKLTEVQGESPGHDDNNIQGMKSTLECANVSDNQNESNTKDLNKDADISQGGQESTVDSGVGTAESRIRSGTDDSVTSLLGEYTPLPTVSPNVTPDVSDILPTGGPTVQSDISDSLPQPGGEQRTSTANPGQDHKLPESTEEPSVHTQTLTTSSMFFMSTDESLNTVAQSCTLPISPVSEDSDATLRDVNDFEEERKSATPVVLDNQQTKPDATAADKHLSKNDISVHSPDAKQSSHEGQDLTTKKGDEVSTPKHVRRGSYTLEMPSPALLQAEEKQKVSPEGRSDYLVREPGQFPVPSRQNAQRSGVYLPDSGFMTTCRYNNTAPSTSGASLLPTTKSVKSVTTPLEQHQHGQQTQHTSRPDSTAPASGETQRNSALDAEASHVPTINPEFLEQELQKYEDLKALMQHQHKMQLALLMQEQERQRLAMHQELELQEERIKMQKTKLEEQYSRQAEISEQERWTESAAALRRLEGRDALPPSPTHNFSRPILHRTAPVSAASQQYSVTLPGTRTMDPSFPTHAILSKGQLSDASVPTSEGAGWRHTQSDTSTSYASPSPTHSQTSWTSQRNPVNVGVQEPFVWHGSPVPKPEVPPPLRMTIHDLTDVPPRLQSKFERLSAAVKGYLTRRLLRTEKLQALRKTIKDTTELIMSLQQETPIRKGMVTTQDAELVQRVMVQLQAALLEVHDVFFQLPVQGQMVIISHDRNIQEERKMKMNKAEPKAAEKRPSRLSSATQKALQRKRQIRAAEAAVFGHSLTAPPRSSSTSPSRRKNTINPRAAKQATKASEVRPKTAPNLNKETGKPAKATSGPKTARRSLYPAVSTMPAKGKNTKYRK